MRRLVYLAFPLIILTACGGSGGSAKLKQTSIPSGGWKVGIPASWKFKDASYPSDHSTWFWTDLSDHRSKLRVVLSGCVGCVSKNFDGVTPNPRADLPTGAVVTAAPNRYTILYSKASSPYPDEGKIVVMRQGRQITGSLIADVWLPKGESAEAAQILDSFRQG